MRIIVAMFLMFISTKIAICQESYTVKKGDFIAYFSLSGITNYNVANPKLNANRLNINGRWFYIIGDTISIRLSYGNTIKIKLLTGSYNPGQNNNEITSPNNMGACEPIQFNYNFNDGESCVLFLNRSLSRED